MKIFNFIKLTRPLNLLIIIFLQCIIKIFLIDQFIKESALTNFNFSLFLLSTVLITAAGYIINDIYDEKIDEINKNDSRIINKKIKSSNAIAWYIAFNIISLIMILYVAWQIQKPIFSLIFVYSIFLLWKYSKELKTKFLRGNIVVSWLIALSIINLALFDVVPVLRNDNSSIIIFKVIIIYAVFSFLMTLSREIIKDTEDKDGDQIQNAKTLIIQLGLEKTKIVINAINILVLTSVACWQYFQYSLSLTSFENDQKIEIWGTDFNSIIYTCVLQVFLLFLIMKTFYAKSKEDFSFISRLSKIIMIIGILSIIVFTKNFV
ncbi:MAG: geranylgeranylglycerol-phosphate geranylgeranyltransferase [Flavobacteriales bacterium]